MVLIKGLYTMNLLKTPLLIKWPNEIKPGTTSDEMVQNLDFAQTFFRSCYD